MICNSNFIKNKIKMSLIKNSKYKWKMMISKKRKRKMSIRQFKQYKQVFYVVFNINLIQGIKVFKIVIYHIS